MGALPPVVIERRLTHRATEVADRVHILEGRMIAFLSIDGHFENIGRGVIDSRDVIYYLSVMGVCLLVATTSLESRKWR